MTAPDNPALTLHAELMTICDRVNPEAVYLAGPMRGYPERNYPAFYEAEARLQAAGFSVINPARIEDKFAGQDWVGCLRRDLVIIALRCSQMAVLPGWQRSAGASLEVHVARALGMPVLDAITLVPLAPGDIA